MAVLVLILVLLYVTHSALSQVFEETCGVSNLETITVEAGGNKQFFHTRHPVSLRTGCSVEVPLQVFQSVRTHTFCLRECYRVPHCVGYNYDWITSKCEIYNETPIRYNYDPDCVYYHVSTNVLKCINTNKCYCILYLYLHFAIIKL